MEQKQKAANIVQNHVYWAGGSGLIPLPLIDLLAVTAIQTDMIRQLCTNYDVSYDDSLGKTLVTALSGFTVSRLGASLVKSLPFVGSIIGGVSMPLLSGATTYAIGRVFIKHFEQGGDLTDLEVSSFLDFYEDMIQKGQEVASNIIEKGIDPSETPESSKQEAPENIQTKLEEIESLKKQGIITEKEFKRIRKRLLKTMA